MSAICTAALSYAERGWLVFPAHSSGKKKSHKAAKYSNGRQWGKTTDLNEIRANWRKWPNANVGIVTGVDSKIFVVELRAPPAGAASHPASMTSHDNALEWMG
jgi:putative DNA primase/helicase